MQHTGKENSTLKSSKVNPLQLRKPEAGTREEQSAVHVYHKDRFVCDTDPRGHATPQGRSILEIVVNVSNGFIPLWAKGVTIQWRFRERSMESFANPEAVKTEIRKLLGEAILAWADAVPVKFTENDDVWDFEIVVRAADNCNNSGCVLASSFFPDAGRHQFVVYPKMFGQSKKEQVDTFIHELGHVFGLRHFFANLETGFPSEVFGTHQKFTIMNYGSDSELTPEDKSDLKRLYQLAWKGELTKINGTPIQFVKPYHTIGAPSELLRLEAIPAMNYLDKRVGSAQQLLQISADLLSGKLTD